jgi:hypothetical protein
MHLDPARVTQVSSLTAQYILKQQQKYLPRAVPVPVSQKTAMSGFFSPQLLDHVRILVLRSERIADPDFYPMLQSLGFKESAQAIGHGSDYLVRCRSFP